MASSKTAANKPQPGKRGPKAMTAVEGAPQLDSASLATRSQELVTMGEAQQAVIAQFGDGLPYVREIYIAESQRDMRMAAEAAVRVGRRLVVMKEHEGHGEWLNCLADIGIGQDTAQRMMAAARRLAALPNTAPARHLIEATKGSSKLFELLSLPEDQFQELAVTGETKGLQLDEIEQMSRDELRAAVREARADLAAKDQRITKLSDDLNKSEEKTVKAQRKWKAASPDEQQVTLEQRVVEAKHELIANIGTQKAGLTAAILDLANHCNENELDCAQFLGDVIGELLGAIREVRDGYEFGFAIPVVNDREG